MKVLSQLLKVIIVTSLLTIGCSSSSSGDSTEDRNNPPSRPILPSPANFQKDVSTKITLSWEKSTDSENTPVTYNLYFGESWNNMAETATNITENSFAILNLQNNKEYYWQVIASDGTNSTKSDIWSFTTIEEETKNRDPEKPELVNPVNNSINTDTQLTLTWSSTDLDGDTLVYDIFFGKENNLQKIRTNYSQSSFITDTLEYSTKYLWKITAKDGKGGESTSDTYNFTTKESYVNNPPSKPGSPTPVDNLKGCSTTIQLLWSESIDPDSGDTVVYDVYFGENEPLTVISQNIVNRSYQLTNLKKGTTYKWRIDAKDNHNNKTIGDLWSFTTIDPENHKPEKPVNPKPVDLSIDQEINITLSWDKCSDPDAGDEVKYDIYMGTTADNLQKISSSIDETTLIINNLNYSTKYFWRVTVKDQKDASTTGEIWSFQTKDSLLISPRNFKVTNVSQNEITLDWNILPEVDYYTIYRSEEENGSYTPVANIYNNDKGKINIHYFTEWSNTNIHYNKNLSTWTTLPGIEMEESSLGSEYKYKSIEANQLKFVFNNGNNIWDNNNDNNYTIDICGTYKIKNGRIHKITNLSYQDKSLTANKTYYYKIRSAAGSDFSQFSEIVPAKTEEINSYQLYIGPYLTWNEQTAVDDGVVVNFKSDEVTKCKVQYKKRTEALFNKETTSEINSSKGHHVVIDNLDPATVYDYRIIKNDGSPNEPKTSIYSFKTAAENPAKFKFALLGDMQDPGDDKQRWKDVTCEVRKDLDYENLNFILIMGDMPVDDLPEHWKRFFDMGSELFPYIVIMPAVGNHDTPSYNSNTDTTSFMDYFDLPGNKEYYSFKYGNSTFIGLFSENSSDFAKNGTQYNWADNRLKSIDSTSNQWVFSYWHIPPYTIGRHAEQQYNFRPITELFDQKVDWVFNGHVHMFQRFNPIKYTSNDSAPYQPYLATSGLYGNGENDGVGYLVSPPAGQYPSTTIEKENYINEGKVAKYSSENEIGYSIVTIENKFIKIITYGMGWDGDSGKEKYIIDDNVTYTKP